MLRISSASARGSNGYVLVFRRNSALHLRNRLRDALMTWISASGYVFIAISCGLYLARGRRFQAVLLFVVFATITIFLNVMSRGAKW